MLLRLERPIPRSDSAFGMHECAAPDNTWQGSAPASPVTLYAVRRCSPSHSRATARHVTLDMLAPVTMTPDCSAGSPRRSRTHETACRSSCAAPPSLLATFWSNAEASQSPATEAIVAPPVT